MSRIKQQLGRQFAARVRQAREAEGDSQERLAEKAQIGLRWYQYIEGKGCLPSFVVGLRLMLLLKLTPQDFADVLLEVDDTMAG